MTILLLNPAKTQKVNPLLKLFTLFPCFHFRKKFFIHPLNSAIFAL